MEEGSHLNQEETRRVTQCESINGGWREKVHAEIPFKSLIADPAVRSFQRLCSYITGLIVYALLHVAIKVVWCDG